MHLIYALLSMRIKCRADNKITQTPNIKSILLYSGIFHFTDYLHFLCLLFLSFGLLSIKLWLSPAMSTRGRKDSSFLHVETVGASIDNINTIFNHLFFNILMLYLLFILDVRTLSEYFFWVFLCYIYILQIIAFTLISSTQSPF